MPTTTMSQLYKTLCQVVISSTGRKIWSKGGIQATPISMSSVADRASRIGPPIAIVVQEAGAIHSIAISVELVS